MKLLAYFKTLYSTYVHILGTPAQKGIELAGRLFLIVRICNVILSISYRNVFSPFERVT